MWQLLFLTALAAAQENIDFQLPLCNGTRADNTTVPTTSTIFPLSDFRANTTYNVSSMHMYGDCDGDVVTPIGILVTAASWQLPILNGTVNVTAALVESVRFVLDCATRATDFHVNISNTTWICTNETAIAYRNFDNNYGFPYVLTAGTGCMEYSNGTVSTYFECAVPTDNDDSSSFGTAAMIGALVGILVVLAGIGILIKRYYGSKQPKQDLSESMLP